MARTPKLDKLESVEGLSAFHAEFLRRVRERAAQLNYGPDELAAEFGVGRSTLYRWLTGQTSIPVEKLPQLVSTLRFKGLADLLPPLDGRKDPNSGRLF